MEKTSNDLTNFSDIPREIQAHIAGYLEIPGLGFFAQSNKQTLTNVLPILRNYQAMFPLRLTAKGDSTYLTQANQLFGCGNNDYGQLGLGDNEHRASFTAVPWPEEQGQIRQVIAGANHTLVLTQDNRLWGCGDNEYGQLGLGDNVDYQDTFSAVPWLEEQGRIQQVFAGKSRTIVLTQDNRLWVCGANRCAQLGLGDNKNRSTFTAVPWPNDRGRIQQVIADGYHTIVLTQDNRLWVCGSFLWGQLGLGVKVNHSIFTAVPWPDDRGKIQQVITGSSHTVVLTQDNQLWVCGENQHGQLGLGDKERRFTFTTVPWSDNRDRIQQVIAGENYTIVLTQDNRLWGCGDNEEIYANFVYETSLSGL